MGICAHVDRITKVFTPDEGCTQPILVNLDTGYDAVEKYPENPQGILSLFNDYFASRIALLAGLTLPEPGMAVVDDKSSIGSCVGNLTTYMGVGFYSKYIKKATCASRRAMGHVDNLDESCRMILVDAIVCNIDRHSSNVLVSYSKDQIKMFIIDFSHAFGGSDWNIDTLKIGDALSPVFWQENKDFYRLLINAGADISRERMALETNYLQNCITEESLNIIISEIPDEWTKKIGQNKIEHAKQYVLKRVSDLTQICEMINQERMVL